MKAQMRFQKYLCLAMIILGAIATLYAFCYCTGSMVKLGQTLDNSFESFFDASEGKYDATLYVEIQSFNNLLMYFGIAMILLAVLLYITSCNKRRNYYVSNYVAIGLCAGGNIIMSVVSLVLNGIWRSKFLNVDFVEWEAYWDNRIASRPGANIVKQYSESTAAFDIGFVVYILVILASVALILNLIWKIKLMQGEKKLLANENLAGGVV